MNFKTLIITLLFFCNAYSFLPLMSSSIARDLSNLEILSSDGSECIFTVVNKTKTKLGSAALRTKLSTLEVSIEQLRKQQNALNLLVSNPDLCKRISTLLEQFATTEKYIDRCVVSLSPAVKTLYDDLYFKHNKLQQYNRNPALLWAAQVLPLAGLVVPTVEHILVHIGLQHITGEKHHHHTHKHKHKSHACITCSADSFLPGFAANALQVAHWAMHGAVMGGVGYEIVQKMKLCKTLQYDLIHVARALRIARELATIIEEYPELKAYYPQLSECQDRLKGIEGSESCKQLVSLLESDSFKGDASIFSHQGKVLVAHRLMQEVKSELTEALALVAEIDVVACLAQVVSSGDNRGTQYSCAHYRDQKEPLLTIKNALHPLAQNHRSPHDLSLGDKNAQHLILTGDNGSGKSMLLKLVGINAWLAQTLAIVPASEVVLTPFADITTVMQIGDATAQEMSYFMNEVAAGEESLNRVQKAKDENGFALCLVDELFKGTNHKKSAAALQEFLGLLSRDNNCISMISTHHSELAQEYQQNNPQVGTAYMIRNDTRENTTFTLQDGVFMPA